MTALLAAIGSLGTVGGIAAVLTLAIMLSRKSDALNAAVLAQLAAKRQADGYRTERDLAVRDLAAVRAELAATTARLTRDDELRNDALTKESTDAQDTIAAAADPGDALNRQLLGTDLPARTAGPTAGDGRGAADALSPSAAADGPGAGSGHRG